MATIASLPNDVLIRIFSHLREYELLEVDRVCRRFNTVVADNLWRRVTVITGEMMGNSVEDRIKNFIEIVRRVHLVKDLSILPTVFSWTLANPKWNKRLKRALIELAQKCSPDATVSLSWLSDMYQLYYSPLSTKSSNLSLLKVRVRVTRILKEFRFCEFDGIRVDQMSVHDDDENDAPFFAIQEGDRRVPVPMDVSHFTRLHIRNLTVRISSVDNRASAAAASHLGRILLFTRLQSVQIENFILHLPNSELAGASLAQVTLMLKPSCSLLGVDRFIAFLDAMRMPNEWERNENILKFLRRLKSDDGIEDGKVSIHSNEFHRIIFWLRMLDLSMSSVKCIPNDAIDAVLSYVLSSHMNSLHLSVAHESSDEDYILSLLIEKGVLRRLRSFSLEVQPSLNPTVMDIIDWGHFIGCHRMVKSLSQLYRSLNFSHIETMKFELTPTSPHSVGVISLVAQPTSSERGTEMQFREMSYKGQPCFAFTLFSIVQSSNLRHLRVSSRPFAHDSGIIKWVETLLRSVDGHTSLRYVQIQIEKDDLKFEPSEKRFRIINGSTNRTGVGQSLTIIRQQVIVLFQTLTHLEAIHVSIPSHDYCFKWERVLARPLVKMD